MATGTFYLKPSADVSLGHSVYPADSTAGYLLINEEVPDEYTTYIYHEAAVSDSPVSVTSKFTLGYNETLPENIKITDCTCHIRIKHSTDSGTATSTHKLIGEKCNIILEIDNNEVLSFNTFFPIRTTNVRDNHMPNINTSGEYINPHNHSLFSLVNIINNYIKENNSLPIITATITTSYDSYSTSSNKEKLKIMIDEFDIEIQYTDYINSYKKDGNEWMIISKAYKKVNDNWIEITESETSNLLNSFQYISSKKEYAYPILKKSNSWHFYKDLSAITAIEIVDSYTPTGSESDSWAIDIDESGDIMCYVNDTTLIIAGNGSGGICLNPDSRGLFAVQYKSEDYSDFKILPFFNLYENFKNTTSIIGTNLLKAYYPTDLDYAFYNLLASIEELDMSNMDIINGTGMCCYVNRTYYSKINKIILSDKITHIYDNMFSNCPYTEILFNDTNIYSIGVRAFYYCESLTSINCPNVTSIGYQTFYKCTSLTNIDLPNVTSIGERAFYYCTSLTDINCPNVTSIGDHAFEDCTLLTSIDLPNVTSIGNSAFYDCYSLTSIDLPNVTSIENYAFGGTNKLTSINVSDSNEYYSSINGILFNKNKDTLIKYPCKITNISYTVPSSVTSIENYAFENCSSLTSIVLPNVTSIGDYAFRFCKALTSIDLPNVTSIETYAFTNCTSLTSIDCHNITSISNCSLAACTKLTTVIIRTNKVCTLNSTSTFDDTPIANGTGYIYVPSTLVDSYKAHSKWKTYANQIRAIEDYPDICG